MQKHVLIVEDPLGSREFLLQDAKYVVGRDPANSLLVRSQFVSRQHALLLRVPMPETGGYRYRLIDGDLDGRPSANGLRVNGQRQTSHDLQQGDVVELGPDARMMYYCIETRAEDGAIPEGTTLGNPELMPLMGRPVQE